MTTKLKNVARQAAAAPGKMVVGYWRGMSYPLTSLKTVYLEHPGLIRIWIWPIVITALALFGMGWAVWEYHEAVMSWMWDEPTGDGWWDSVKRGVHSVVEFLVGAFLLVAGVIVAQILGSLIAAPFNDALSEALEHRFIGREAPPFRWKGLVRDIATTVGLEAGKIGLYLCVMLPLWVLSFALPGIGQLVYVVFGFLFSAMYLALDYVDWPAARREWTVGRRLQLARRHFWAMFGFGTGVWALLFVPFVNLLFMPAAVAAGTRLFLDLEGEESATQDESKG